MSEKPLMELEESRIFGLWPRRLLIFEDRVETLGTELLQETVAPLGYGQIDRVTISNGVWFANLLVGNRGGRPILMRGLNGDIAERAKALIEERVAQAGASPPRPEKPSAARDTVDLVHKLAELRDAGVLTQEEFEAKKRSITTAECSAASSLPSANLYVEESGWRGKLTARPARQPLHRKGFREQNWYLTIPSVLRR
jgi:hypothetical protein